MAKLTVTTRALKKAKKERKLNQTRTREQPPNPGKGLQVKTETPRGKKSDYFAVKNIAEGPCWMSKEVVDEVEFSSQLLSVLTSHECPAPGFAYVLPF